MSPDEKEVTIIKIMIIASEKPLKVIMAKNFADLFHSEEFLWSKEDFN